MNDPTSRDNNSHGRESSMSSLSSSSYPAVLDLAVEHQDREEDDDDAADAHHHQAIGIGGGVGVGGAMATHQSHHRPPTSFETAKKPSSTPLSLLQRVAPPQELSAATAAAAGFAFKPVAFKTAASSSSSAFKQLSAAAIQNQQQQLSAAAASASASLAFKPAAASASSAAQQEGRQNGAAAASLSAAAPPPPALFNSDNGHNNHHPEQVLFNPHDAAAARPPAMMNDNNDARDIIMNGFQQQHPAAAAAMATSSRGDTAPQAQAAKLTAGRPPRRNQEQQEGGQRRGNNRSSRSNGQTSGGQRALGSSSGREQRRSGGRTSSSGRNGEATRFGAAAPPLPPVPQAQDAPPPPQSSRTRSSSSNLLLHPDRLTLDMRSYRKLEEAIVEVKLFLEDVREMALGALGGGNHLLGNEEQRAPSLFVTIITGEAGNGSPGAILRSVLQKIFRNRDIAFIDHGSGDSFQVDALSGIRDEEQEPLPSQTRLQPLQQPQQQLQQQPHSQSNNHAAQPQLPPSLRHARSGGGASGSSSGGSNNNANLPPPLANEPSVTAANNIQDGRGGAHPLPPEVMNYQSMMINGVLNPSRMESLSSSSESELMGFLNSQQAYLHDHGADMLFNPFDHIAQTLLNRNASGGSGSGSQGTNNIHFNDLSGVQAGMSLPPLDLGSNASSRRRRPVRTTAAESALAAAMMGGSGDQQALASFHEQLTYQMNANDAHHLNNAGPPFSALSRTSSRGPLSGGIPEDQEMLERYHQYLLQNSNHQGLTSGYQQAPQEEAMHAAISLAARQQQHQPVAPTHGLQMSRGSGNVSNGYHVRNAPSSPLSRNAEAMNSPRRNEAYSNNPADGSPLLTAPSVGASSQRRYRPARGRGQQNNDSDIRQAISESQASHIAHTRQQVADDIQFRRTLERASNESSRQQQQPPLPQGPQPLHLQEVQAGAGGGGQESSPDDGDEETLLQMASRASLIDEQDRQSEAQRTYDAEMELAVRQSEAAHALKQQEDDLVEQNEEDLIAEVLIKSQAEEEEDKHSENEVLRTALLKSMAAEENVNEEELVEEVIRKSLSESAHSSINNSSIPNDIQTVDGNDPEVLEKILKLSLEEKKKEEAEEQELINKAMEWSVMELLATQDPSNHRSIHRSIDMAPR